MRMSRSCPWNFYDIIWLPCNDATAGEEDVRDAHSSFTATIG